MRVDDVPKLWSDKVRELIAKMPNKEQKISKKMIWKIL